MRDPQGLFSTDTKAALKRLVQQDRLITVEVDDALLAEVKSALQACARFA